jgi:G3E family GTPase
LIETTGLADPLPILQSILQHPYLSKRFSVAALVTLVDAVHGVATLEAHAEARRQVALADRLLITKAELVPTGDHARLLAALTALNPTIPVLESEPSDFASGLFAGRFEPWQRGDGDIVAWLGAAETDRPPSTHQPSHLGEDIASFSFVTETPIEPAALIVFQEAMRVLHGPRLLRLKGIIALSDDPERPAVIHHVQSVAHPMHRLARWPGRDRRSRLVFIVQGVAGETIERFWQALANPGPGGQTNR